MDKILDKLSTYNIFNYLFPGAVFCFVIDTYFHASLIQDNIMIGVFLYYFVGLVISRFGSIMLEPLLKKTKIIQFCDYSDFIMESKKDSKIELLSEVNNMYRTILSMLVIIMMVAFYIKCTEFFPQIKEIGKYLIIIGLFVLFLFSYKKQTEYISKRVLTSKNS